MLEGYSEYYSANLPLYEKELSETENSIENMLNAIQQGILMKSTKSRLEKLETAKDDLEAKIACEKLAKLKLREDFVRFWLMKFRKLDMTQQDHRKMLIDTFVNSIYLYDDKMLLAFNYKEGAETITFEDAKKSLAKGSNGSDLDRSAPPKSTALKKAVFF